MPRCRALPQSGTLTHWFRDQFARDLAGPEAFVRLAEEAGRSPKGANGIVFLPYFSASGRRFHDTHAKGHVVRAEPHA